MRDPIRVIYDADETELRDLGIHVPEWMDQDLDTYQLAAILEGGCASGAYMPAVTYHEASRTMDRHGEAVTEFLGDYADAFTYDPHTESWASFATRLLSAAVEAWAHSIADEVAETLEWDSIELDDEGEEDDNDS